MSRKKGEKLNLHLEHGYWEANLAQRGYKWLDKVIKFLNESGY